MHFFRLGRACHQVPLVRFVSGPVATSRGHTCVLPPIRALGDEDEPVEFEPWMIRRLKEEYLKSGGSKKELKIKQLSGDLGVHRTEIMSWYKEYTELPEKELAEDLDRVRVAMEKRLAEKDAKKQAELNPRSYRQEEEEDEKGVEEPLWDPIPSDRARSPSSASFREEKKGVALSFGQRMMRGLVGKQRMNKTVELTLEMIYERTKWPNDDVIKSVYDLHRLPRREVLDWFQNKRARDEGKIRRGGGGRGRGRGSGESADPAAEAATKPFPSEDAWEGGVSTPRRREFSERPLRGSEEQSGRGRGSGERRGGDRERSERGGGGGGRSAGGARGGRSTGGRGGGGRGRESRFGNGSSDI